MKGQLCIAIILLCHYAAAGINSLNIAEGNGRPQNSFQMGPASYASDPHWDDRGNTFTPASCGTNEHETLFNNCLNSCYYSYCPNTKVRGCFCKPGFCKDVTDACVEQFQVPGPDPNAMLNLKSQFQYGDGEQ